MIQIEECCLVQVTATIGQMTQRATKPAAVLPTGGKPSDKQCIQHADADLFSYTGSAGSQHQKECGRNAGRCSWEEGGGQSGHDKHALTRGHARSVSGTRIDAGQVQRMILVLGCTEVRSSCPQRINVNFACPRKKKSSGFLQRFRGRQPCSSGRSGVSASVPPSPRQLPSARSLSEEGSPKPHPSRAVLPACHPSR